MTSMSRTLNFYNKKVLDDTDPLGTFCGTVDESECIIMLHSFETSWRLSLKSQRAIGVQADDLPSRRPAGVENKSSAGSERMRLWKNQAGYLGSNACECSDQSD